MSIDGVVQYGDISPAGDADDYYFSITAQNLADAGGEYVVKLSLSGDVGDFEPRARLYSPLDAEIGGELAGGTRDNPRTLTQAGTYTIWVYDRLNDDTGPYSLGLEGLVPPSLDAVAIAPGDVVSGDISLVAETDAYTFTGAIGGIVTLSLAETDSGNFHPRAVLYSPSGEEVDLFSATTGSSLDYVSGGGKVLSEPFSEAGTYVIQVYDNDFSDTGSYYLALEGLHPASLDAVDIALGETRSGAIEAGEVDEYVFVGSAGAIVTVSLSDAVPGTSSELWAVLYAPSGAQVEKLPGTSGPDEVENGAKVIYELPETGTYVIQVFDGDYTHPEAYGIALEGLNPPSLPPYSVALSSGGVSSGTIEQMGEVDEFTLAGWAGETITLSFDSETTVDYKPRAVLYAPSGAMVNDFTPGETRALVLSETGPHVLQVFDNDYTDTGAGLIASGKDPRYYIALSDARRSSLAGRVSSTGQWWVARSTGTAFVNEHWGGWAPGGSWLDVHEGDFNGDGLADLAGRWAADGSWWIALNDSNRALVNQRWGRWSVIAWNDVVIGDFNGDGNDDIAGRTSGGYWWVAASNGTSGFANELWGRWSAIVWNDVLVGDFNGDGRDDIAGRTAGGDWWVARSNAGAGFVNERWGRWSAIAWLDVLVGDFNRDGRDDIAGRTTGGDWWVAVSSGAGTFANQNWGHWAAVAWHDVQVGDFNGDGAADIAGRTGGGQWWVARSTGSDSFVNQSWGHWAAVPWNDVVAGDFNGDGRDDLAGRTNGGDWWVAKTNAAGGSVNEFWGHWSNSVTWLDVLLGEFDL